MGCLCESTDNADDAANLSVLPQPLPPPLHPPSFTPPLLPAAVRGIYSADCLSTSDGMMGGVAGRQLQCDLQRSGQGRQCGRCQQDCDCGHPMCHLRALLLGHLQVSYQTSHCCNCTFKSYVSSWQPLISKIIVTTIMIVRTTTVKPLQTYPLWRECHNRIDFIVLQCLGCSIRADAVSSSQ